MGVSLSVTISITVSECGCVMCVGGCAKLSVKVKVQGF